MFPSQINIHPDIKIPILQAHQASHQGPHQSQNPMLALVQNVSPTQHHPQELHINAVSAAQGPTTEHYITVAQTHSTHMPHVSNLSRHINTRLDITVRHS